MGDYQLVCNKCNLVLGVVHEDKLHLTENARLLEADSLGRKFYKCKSCGSNRVYKPLSMKYTRHRVIDSQLVK